MTVCPSWEVFMCHTCEKELCETMVAQGDQKCLYFTVYAENKAIFLQLVPVWCSYALVAFQGCESQISAVF